MKLDAFPLELHNVEELVEHEGGWLLQRVPEVVRQTLHSGAQSRARHSPGIELRFVWDWGQPCEITLGSSGATKYVPFYGCYQGLAGEITGQEPTTVSFAAPARLQATDLALLPQRSFSPRVGRLLLLGDPVVLYGAKGAGMRPPDASELPKQRYVAYGSSITHGYGASAPHLTYPARVGRALGWDVINLGFRGSAWANPELADYLAEQDWDVLSLEASVNMLSQFTAEEFGQRWWYFIDRVARAKPNKPVVVLNTLQHFRDLGTELGPQNDGVQAEEYREQIRQIIEATMLPNVSLLEHDELLREDTGLLGDLLHPGDDGYEWIARGIVAYLQQRWGITPEQRSFATGR